MKTAAKKAKPKAAKRAPGRPRVEAPGERISFRFDAELMADLDAWARDHGKMGRSAAIRLAISNLVKGRTL